MARRNLPNITWRTEMSSNNEIYFNTLELIEKFNETRSKRQIYKILVDENHIPSQFANEMLKEYYIGEETKQRN
jgi:hypothetical protein